MWRIVAGAIALQSVKIGGDAAALRGSRRRSATAIAAAGGTIERMKSALAVSH
jgi:hypothetical protein